MSTNEQVEYWQTSDLALASALTSLGHKVVNLDRSQPRKICFVFIVSPSLNRSVQEFWSDTLNISPRIYFDAIKTLKSRIYSEL